MRFYRFVVIILYGHTNATLMLKHNISPKVASERLGHSTISITLDLYSHVLKEMQEDASQKIDKAIFNIESDDKDNADKK